MTTESEVDITFCETCTERARVIDDTVCPREAMDNLQTVLEIIKAQKSATHSQPLAELVDSEAQPGADTLMFNAATGEFKAVKSDEAGAFMSLKMLSDVEECIVHVQEHGERVRIVH